MDLTALLTEMYARGFNSFSETAAGITRATRYINGGRAELDRLALWPWRQTTVSGAAPLAVTNLGPIMSVTDTSGNPLRRIDPYGDQTQTGSPSGYYADWSSGSSKVAVYPVSTATITVKHWKVTPDLVAGTDTPVSPTEAHYLIVDLAVRRALMDSDNPDAAAAVQGEVDRQIDALLFQYPVGVADGPDAMTAVGFASEDW